MSESEWALLDGRVGRHAVTVYSRPVAVPVGQDDYLVELGGDRLRVAVFDGATPIETTPCVAGVDGAVWAAGVVRIALRDTSSPIASCLEAANRVLLAAFGGLPARARPQASVVACDVTDQGLTMVQAGDCAAWIGDDDGWREALPAKMLTPEGQRWFDDLLRGDSRTQDEQPLYEDPSAWATSPVGLFRELKVRVVEETRWNAFALASDGALLDARALGDLPRWQQTLREAEAAVHEGCRRRKERDDATAVVVRRPT